MAIKSFFRNQFPAIFWAGFIFAASSIPGAKLPHFILSINDKVIHTGVYFVLGLVMYRGLGWIERESRLSYLRLVLAFTIVVLYGISDEIHQGFVPGRTVDVLDAGADALGGLLSGIMVLVYFRKKQ